MMREEPFDAGAIGLVSITDSEFGTFQKLLHSIAGISLGPAKRHLLTTRLHTRLRALNMNRYSAYLDHVRQHPDELQRVVDLLTTNETYFFREPVHFEFIREQILPKIPPGRTFRVWSAASSSGEEAYTTAMVLAEHLPNHPWEILGSDISTRVLDRAQRGVYPIESAEKIPRHYLQKYCLRGVRSQEGQLLICNELRSRVQFRQVNLNAVLPSFVGEMDLIFLRNVMIYFDIEMKRRVVGALIRQLRPGGHFIIGLAETLKDICDELTLRGPTIYQRPAR